MSRTCPTWRESWRATTQNAASGNRSAAAGGIEWSVQMLLGAEARDAAASPDANGGGATTSLMLAAHGGHVGAMRLLLDAHAKAGGADEGGQYIDRSAALPWDPARGLCGLSSVPTVGVGVRVEVLQVQHKGKEVLQG